MFPAVPVAGVLMGISESPKLTVFCWMSVTPTLLPAGE
jgi:cytochrome b561